MSLSQVKQVAQVNNIKKVSHLNRRELIDLLTAKGIAIPERKPRAKRTEVTQVEPMVETTTAVRDYSRISTIRTNPRRVRITDITTNDVREFPSLYSAGKSLNHSSKTIIDYIGRIYGDTHRIEILPTEAIQTITIDGGNEETQS